MQTKTFIEKTADWITGNRVVSSVSRGLVALVPVVLIGAFLTAALSIPIPAWQEFLSGAGRTISGINLAEALRFSTINILSIAALISISYVSAQQNPFVVKRETGIAPLLLTAVSSYIILAATPGDTLIFRYPGGEGLLYALIAAILSERLYNLFFRVLHGKFKVSSLSVYTELRTAFRSILPIFFTLIAFAGIRLFILDPFFKNGDFQANLTSAVNSLMAEDSAGAAVLIVLIVQICWFFGLHGGFLVLDHLPSVSAYSADALGQTILSREFFTVFTTAGGAGVTIGLILALLLFGSKQLGKPLARLSVVPAVFNINETMTYGIPIILNPFYLLPFIISPVVCGLISYMAIAAGWVPHIMTATPWSTPVFYAGFVATGSNTGVVLQVFCMFISAAVYAPFVWLKQKTDQRKLQENLRAFQDAAMEAAEIESVSLLLRSDQVGAIARDFAADITRRFEINDIPFHLVYQPKTDGEGRVMGAEVLLRWTHPQLGAISPVVIIEIGDEAGLSTKIGRWVFDRATDQLAAWRESGDVDDITFSINLNPRHLHDDPDFCDYVVSETDRKGIPHSLVELEITEHNAIHSGSDVPVVLKTLKAAGFELSIDDLGMGYSSLTYISDFGASVVKIDKSIADGVVGDEMLREIVRSVVHLARQLSLKVLIEGVEDSEQVTLLENLGVHYYQGYYFSKPLSEADFVRYCAEHGYMKKASILQ